ncbi:MAG TPA: TIM barrel protein [Phycisphaerae bacterium]|nr:TIM barrel protein [Phycisphaerae bacterium]HRY68505.1 TIM barrel protein [Phycisphaerae bacterium]HSA25553.1 TIM barrel protein [Phycisphaerae bacterium]
MAVSKVSDCAQRMLDRLEQLGRDPKAILSRLKSLEIETPSWGYADTGTRFGKFHQAAAARSIQEKLDDAGQVHKLTGICPSVAVHVLWDFPHGADAKVTEHARKAGVRIGAMNPNVFQSQCYKYGSFGNRDPEVRRKAVKHCLDSVKLGKDLGSEYLSLWFADGTNYPGQDDIRARKKRFADALKEVHKAMPSNMIMLVEYKPFEPAFYHTDIADWGMACLLARAAGPQARVLVDTGHHYLAQNIEQIVAWLIDENMLGGFHFNDRRYADDDLTMGSIDPYQVFRIFHEIIAAEEERGQTLKIAYMVDQSHNLKPKIEAMIQTVTTAHELFAKALLVDRKKLRSAQAKDDLVEAEETLRAGFFTDTRPLIGYVREQMGIEADALAAHRASGYEARVAKERTEKYGVPTEASFA